MSKIEGAYRSVLEAESGQLEWMELLGRDSGPAFSEVENLSERFGEVISRMRLTEAAAYTFRDQGEVTEKRLIELRVAEMRAQVPAIDDLEERIEEMTLEELAELGKFFAKERCRWAKNVVVNSFKAWGY